MMNINRKYVALTAAAAGVGSLLALGHSAVAAPPSVVSRAAVVAPAAQAEELRVFVRQPGKGNRELGGRLEGKLRSAFNLSGTAKVEDKGNRTWYEAPSWRMRVSDEGNNLRFRKDRPANVKSIPVSAKPRQADVVDAALSVVKTTLSDVVKLGQGEELVLLGIRAEYQGGHSSDSKKHDPTLIGGWTAGFGRAIGGKLVVGGGSHVAVTFDPSGAVEALDVDWPEYANAGVTLRTVSEAVVRERGKKRELPLQANERRAEEALECGYFDPGGRRVNTRVDFLQPGCVRRIVSQATDLAPGNSEKWATIQVIPSAEVPMKDQGWTEAAPSCDDPKGCDPE